jgi:hypothetical protein
MLANNRLNPLDNGRVSFRPPPRRPFVFWEGGPPPWLPPGRLALLRDLGTAPRAARVPLVHHCITSTDTQAVGGRLGPWCTRRSPVPNSRLHQLVLPVDASSSACSRCQQEIVRRTASAAPSSGPQGGQGLVRGSTTGGPSPLPQGAASASTTRDDAHAAASASTSTSTSTAPASTSTRPARPTPGTPGVVGAKFGVGVGALGVVCVCYVLLAIISY